jgi:hypothetical protein
MQSQEGQVVKRATERRVVIWTAHTHRHYHHPQPLRSTIPSHSTSQGAAEKVSHRKERRRFWFFVFVFFNGKTNPEFL